MRYISPSERRRQSANRWAVASVTFVVIATVAIVYACVAIDNAHGITVAESVEMWGL